MRLEARKYLFDIQQAAGRLAEFTGGRTLETYVADAMLRAAVERQFEIIGEALAQLRKLEPNVAETSRTRLPVVARKDGTLMGMVALTDLLTARARVLDAEQRRERVIWTHIRLPFFGRAEGR